MVNCLYWYPLQYHPDNLELMQKSLNITFFDAWNEVPDNKSIEVLFPPPHGDITRLSRFPNARIVAANITRQDHWNKYKEKVKIITLHGETDFLQSITPTVEHTIGLIIAIHRKIPWAFYDHVLYDKWDRRQFAPEKQLSSMVLGVIGMGRIGHKVSIAARGLGMKTIPFDKHYNQEALNYILEESDIITLHLPLTERTRHFMNKERINKMKPGAYLVNTARGELVDTDALIKALQRNHLAGAALDVVEREPSVPEFVIEHASMNSNLLITPHIGGSTKDAWYRTERFIIEKVLACLKESGHLSRQGGHRKTSKK